MMRAGPKICSLCLAALALVPALLAGGCGRTPRQLREAAFVADGRTLVRIAYVIPEEAAGRGVLFDRKTLSECPLYLRAPDGGDEDYIYIGPDGCIERAGQSIGTVAEGGELLFSADGVRLFADARPVALAPPGWDVLWVTADAAAPAVRSQVYPRIAFADGFMRTHLEEGQCRALAGRWRLLQHGGGMPTTEAQMRDPSFQRAANPFAVVGEGNGLLGFGDGSWFDFHGEARFYFGVPVEGEVVDTDTVPVATDMLVVHGAPGHEQAAFGWRGDQRAFVLLGRPPGGEWRELGRRDGPRPAVTSWMKLGLSVALGTQATAFLDGVPVLTASLPSRVTGPFGVLCGQAPVECDDIRAWSLASPPDPGEPLYARSSQFAEKKKKEHADPEQFDQWAQGADTFLQWRGRDASAVIANRIPLVGDFEYEALTAGTMAGRMPPGLYEFRVAEVPMAPATRPAAAWDGAAGLTARLGTDGVWEVGGLPERAAPERLPVLRLRRAAGDDSRMALWAATGWRPFTDPLPGPLRLMIARRPEGTLPSPPFPDPDHHRISCRNLVNDFFETAPTDWSWIEGSFRMACRWACQDQWNFMACGATGTPYMASKRTFAGRQFFECYLSLRPVYPWDAGDPSFTYDPGTDHNWEIFVAHEGWYNRHDLNFSFCGDGRNPLSGYAVVFGGDDNRETRLLRQGKIVARTSEERFLFPTEIPHGVIHWRWWRFSVWKDGGQIRVDLNGTRMLAYDDPAPLDGGHAAFWTVRNGFALSRATLFAERVAWEPEVLYVADAPAAAWQPRPADSATLTVLPDGRTRAVHNAGAGPFALRHRFEPPPDLAQTPVLEVPLRQGPGTEQNLHLEIGGRSFLVRISAPLSGMKALLTPEFERGECFRLPVMPEAAVRERYLLGEAATADGHLRFDLGKALQDKGIQLPHLRLTVLTLGNTSNTGYRLAGGEGCNPAGAFVEVGEPRLLGRD